MQYIGLGSPGGGIQGSGIPQNGGWHPLSLESAAAWGASHFADVTANDIVAAQPALATATSLVLGIYALGPGQLISCEAFRLLVPFANANDATQNSTSIEVGDNGTATLYLGATETNLNGAYVPIKAGTAATGVTAYTAANVLQILFAAPAAGKTLSNLTQGWLRLYFRLRDNNLPA